MARMVNGGLAQKLMGGAQNFDGRLFQKVYDASFLSLGSELVSPVRGDTLSEELDFRDF
jgi:hypothetical protein